MGKETPANPSCTPVAGHSHILLNYRYLWIEPCIPHEQISSLVKILSRFSWQAAESPNGINTGLVKAKEEGTENSQRKRKEE